MFISEIKFSLKEIIVFLAYLIPVIGAYWRLVVKISVLDTDVKYIVKSIENDNKNCEKCKEKIQQINEEVIKLVS